MFSDSVAQKPTIAVSPAPKTGRNSDTGSAFDDPASTTDSPPARPSAHTISATPTSSRNGALRTSSHLIDSMPFRMK